MLLQLCKTLVEKEVTGNKIRLWEWRFDDTCIYIVPIKQVTLNHCKRVILRDLLNRAKSKVSLLILDFFSIAARAAILKTPYVRISLIFELTVVILNVSMIRRSVFFVEFISCNARLIFERDLAEK